MDSPTLSLHDGRDVQSGPDPSLSDTDSAAQPHAQCAPYKSRFTQAQELSGGKQTPGGRGAAGRAAPAHLASLREAGTAWLLPTGETRPPNKNAASLARLCVVARLPGKRRWGGGALCRRPQASW